MSENECGATDPNGPKNGCVRPRGHDAAREGHSAPLGVHENGEWEWHHWQPTEANHDLA